MRNVMLLSLVNLIQIALFQLLRVGFFYNIKVIEDTARHHEESSNIFSSKVTMVQAEFSPVNCPLSPHPVFHTGIWSNNL